MSNSRLVLFALWLLMFSASGQVLLISPLLPTIAAEFDVPVGLLGTLLTPYAVALAIFALWVGPISDRVGRRRILIGGSAAMTLALLLHWFADSYAMLMALRALAGACGGILTGVSVAYVGDFFP